MADSIAGTWASLADVEIVNDARTLAYLKQSELGSIQVYGDCGCSNIVDLLDCPGVTGYINPAQDDAPWYTSDTPASADFLGFVVSEFNGLDSPFERTVKQNITNGGVLGRSRLASREMTWTGYLFGNSCCGTQYGLKWLSQALSRFNPSCKDCLGDDLELLICCPDEDMLPATGVNSPFRTLKGVGLIEGPKILSQRKTCTNNCSGPGGCGGSCILEIEFTLVASQPYMYSPEVPVYDCVNIYEGSISIPFEIESECPPFNCIVDPCEIVLPPTATYQNLCVSGFSSPRVNYYSVSRGYWTELDEVVPVISINAGAYGLDHIRLGFYENANGNPCGDILLGNIDCDVICDELDIVNIPENSTFYIDGRNRKMSVICVDGAAFAGERLTLGPWSWPTFNCFGFCLQVMFESNTPNLAEQASCISISLVPRSF